MMVIILYRQGIPQSMVAPRHLSRIVVLLSHTTYSGVVYNAMCIMPSIDI